MNYLSGIAITSALMIMIGAAAVLCPRTLMAISPFRKFTFYQRIIQSRPLMMVARFGGAIMLILGAIWIWQEQHKGQFEKIASSEYALTARRMDAITVCHRQPQWKANWSPGHVNPNKSAIFTIKCMASQGYQMVKEAKGCSNHDADREKWKNWPQADDAQCYRSIDPKTRVKEEIEPLPVPFMGAP